MERDVVDMQDRLDRWPAYACTAALFGYIVGLCVGLVI